MTKEVFCLQVENNLKTAVSPCQLGMQDKILAGAIGRAENNTTGDATSDSGF